MASYIPVGDLRISARPANGHKGQFGRVLLIGGSVGMSGAACLSATAALRGGAGLVTVAVPSAIQTIVAGCEPSYMTVGLSCDSEGQLSGDCLEQIRTELTGKDAVAVGPGLGQSPVATEVVRCVLNEASCPMVLDADALNLAARDKLLPETERRFPCILTPHPGEFSRITGKSTGDINRSREESAKEFASENRVVVVLKGAGTVVTDGNRVYVNATGNAGMATGGSGDVLTGIVAAQLAQGLEPVHAASLAVYLHGLAGDLAAEVVSEPGLIASDLPRFLGAAWRNFLNQSFN